MEFKEYMPLHIYRSFFFRMSTSTLTVNNHKQLVEPISSNNPLLIQSSPNKEILYITTAMKVHIKLEKLAEHNTHG